MATLVSIGKKETYNFQVDDNSLLSELSRLKTYYERMEDQLTNLDAGYKCKVGDMEMEYDISEKGFKSFAKDMMNYYDGLMKDMKKQNKDSVDAEIKALKAEIEKKDNAVVDKAKSLFDLVTKAQSILNCDASSLFNKSETQIKQEVIKQVYPNLDTANESEEAINAMFKVATQYQEDSKTKVERHKEILKEVTRQPAQPPINYNEDTELSPRMKHKTNAWKLGLGVN